MSEVHETRLARRVAQAAATQVRRSRSVSAIEVFQRLGWLPPLRVTEWRQGRLDPLEAALTVRSDKIDTALRALRDWAAERGLEPVEAAYVAATRDRRPLRFAARTGTPADRADEIERAYRTHWLSPGLSPARRESIAARQSKAPDLMAIQPSRTGWTCASCHRDGGEFMVVEDAEPLCLTCADMDHLVFLPAGNAALSRRAKKESGLSAIVVQPNRRRKRYERRGVLVEEEALARAEEQCLADEDARARRRERDRRRRARQDEEFQARMAEGIRRLFPGCPPERAQAIASHASLRGSGRVGRSAAGRELDEDALHLAVAASVRHQDTDYDALLMAGVSRRDARDRIRATVEAVLDSWRREPG
ncbi:hypothetical protein Acsp03_25970 [Actinomadura sp. NBRC 104412]|uniref:DUF2293 domain-containing protein n=1 Tax=Actinomadura sp. NBRC 104412 TaxID=3032203 RepID=UPI0024A0C0DF|nr:DUF2293 domain-containing protein [Actinomadura sp. NBRC 104412]GLZ05131.1 hypothetical protein Acsp03_25970 [Actinomadura sp. NBRC 104412]